MGQVWKLMIYLEETILESFRGKKLFEFEHVVDVNDCLKQIESPYSLQERAVILYHADLIQYIYCQLDVRSILDRRFIMNNDVFCEGEDLTPSGLIYRIPIHQPPPWSTWCSPR